MNHDAAESGPTTSVAERVRSYPLLDALTYRRSRRFAAGMKLNGGPLAYESARPPQPLTTEEEAALAFAACGVTGYALGELPYETGSVPDAGGGNIMKQFVARTAPSADALHAVTVFMINDEGAWMLRRPQDFPGREVAALVQAARERGLSELFERSRVRIAGRRLDVPRELPFVPPFNKWSANVPGSTYFIPVNELTALYINILLSAFNGDFNYFVVDDRNGFRPAGIGKFARSKGGPLHDDPAEGRFMTVTFLESWLFELAAVEQGAMVQNLGLMNQALGLGGFPHFAAHPFGWTQALGFRMQQPRLSRVTAAGTLMKAALKLFGKDILVPTAVGLEQEGQVLIRPYCPPYFASMKEAVLAFVDAKYAGAKGSFRDGGETTAWLDAPRVQAGIPEYSSAAIEATIAYCEYVYGRYGRFPAACGPFRTVLAYQAHRLDPDFYARYYRPDAGV
ncbi:MAG TPA: hypothetical protein VKT71_08985 [Candidatus Acidoferrales bacterium]|nr:hypothetical protein [Candidatus Acidoferrales bacterium]